MLKSLSLGSTATEVETAGLTLYHLPTGELVYFVASVVVLHNVEEGTQRHYTGHNDDVKCLAVHPGSNHHGLCPHVRIWSSVDLTTLHVLGLGDFERAVSCLAFSRADGGTHLCVVDDANEHAISVWDWSRGHKLTETKTSTEPVLACECHPLDAGVIITCGKNQLAFWTLEGSRQAEVRALPDILQNGDLITGDSNGSILVWPRGSTGLARPRQAGLRRPDRRLVQWDSAYNRTGAEATVPEQYGPIRTLAQGHGRSEQIECLEFSPHLRVRLHRGRGKYSRIVRRCCGHSSFITHLTWSLPTASPAALTRRLRAAVLDCRQLP
uniref:WD_REPEATS_REGION domain-containing protein n=1 Tax=Macrostomum lignano TaxID=282301 RepID=A0A1I8F3L8_9PLAT